MKVTRHSEYLKLASVYLKSAKNSFLSEEELSEHWETLQYLSKPNFKKSLEEYAAFQTFFREKNISTCFFPINKKTKIDSIYCRDASIATDFGIIICNMGKQGRIHEPYAQLEAYKMNNVNILGEIKFPADHLSWYQLTIEPNTEFHSRPPNLPNEDILSEIQDQGQLLIEAAGLSQYEISAYAKRGSQAQHNVNYWNFGDYIGAGAGAHGKISAWHDGAMIIQRRAKLRQPKAYMAAISALSSSHYVAPEEIKLEFFMNIFRLQNGVPTANYLALTGQSLAHAEPSIAAARKAGLMQPDRLQASPLGWRFLNDLLRYFE